MAIRIHVLKKERSMSSTVLVERMEPEGPGLERQISDAMTKLGIARRFDEARAVFIKPNLTYDKYKEGVTTRVEFVEAIVRCLRKINSVTRIYIGEGEGGSQAFSMTKAMEAMGFPTLESKYPNVRVINLSTVLSRSVELKAFGKPYSLDLPALFFDEVDFSITCPVPKVHCMTKITLSYKNQWGCLPDTMRLRNHYAFDEIIAQVSDVLKFRYAFLDGKFGLDDNGPMNGTPVRLDWFVASDSLGAFDLTVAEMMCQDWRKVGHLRKARALGLMPEPSDVDVVGDRQALRREFTLRRNFWNYPALAAFKSKRLTRIVYLSRVSKLLHDIMYTFRRRPLE
jgi:uncharacterized protein (DUF362 family)